MIPASLTQSSVAKGEPITLRARIDGSDGYGQVQVEILNTGLANPQSVLGFGNTPRRLPSGEFEVDIDTGLLAIGIYEVGLIRLHSPVAAEDPQLDFAPVRDFPRQPFEVRSSADVARIREQLLALVQEREQSLEREFAKPVDLRGTDVIAGDSFAALVFIRDLLIAVRMRFDHFEVIPTHSGLDGLDSFSFVNQFLKGNSTGIEFPYNDSARQTSRRNSPVCVVHFPALTSGTIEAVRDHCVARANTLLLALALSRDAGGAIFDVVVVKNKTGEATKFGIASPYVGNLLVGGLSGEDFASVHAYLQGIAAKELNRFLVGLYREARREPSRDFQYVRFWQILETLAESRNYNPAEIISDPEGQPLVIEGEERRSKGSVNTVFRLLREAEFGDVSEAWKRVNIWFAFRNAVAHHGAVSRYTELSHDSVRKWGALGWEEVRKTPAQDALLWRLKESAKLLLMRELVAAAGPQVASR